MACVLRHVISHLTGFQAGRSWHTPDLHSSRDRPSQKAGYLAKYTTKSIEATGFSSTRLDADTIGQHRLGGNHIDRLIGACWRLGRPIRPVPISGHLLAALVKRATDKAALIPAIFGVLGALAASYVRAPNLGGSGLHAYRGYVGSLRGPFVQPWNCPDCGTHTRYRACPVCTAERQASLDTKPASSDTATNPYTRLRRWAHRFGFAGHFLTKTRRRVVRFATLRDTRVNFRRTEDQAPTDAGTVRAVDHLDETPLIVGTLSFAGVGWHNGGDALLANTAAAMARARQEVGREELAHEIGSSAPSDVLAAA